MKKHFKKIIKAFTLFSKRRYILGMIKGVGAAVEHKSVVENSSLMTLIDVGANVGQFSLLVRESFPEAVIVAFEPLAQPRGKYNELFKADEKTRLVPAAIGAESRETTMHVSNSVDSSSLLEISKTQSDIYPGTQAVGIEEVKVGTLSEFVDVSTLARPIFMKIDVQGYEKNVLEGSLDVIDQIDMIYVECSFVELYVGQALASDVMSMLISRNFVLRGVHNMNYDSDGNAVQGDFLFVQKV